MIDAPGLSTRIDPATKGYVFNHTMLRVRDPKVSLDFYSRILGMSLVRKVDFPEWKFSLYFLAYVPEGTHIPEDEVGRARYTNARESVLELTHNWGTEEKAETPYVNGNGEARGFGHICVSVPSLAAACARFEELGVRFQKRMGEGGMKNIAFIKDPDDYWIEIVEPGLLG